MMLQKRVECAFALLKNKDRLEQMTPEERAEYFAKQGISYERGDLFSMTIAAWAIILPLALITLLIVAGLPLLLIWLFL